MTLNKYPTRLPENERRHVAKKANRIHGKSLRCFTCERDTPHYGNGRVGVNGPVLVCVNCGTERAA
jgi:hypothetical protein